jgi:hypothetical protein
MTTTQGAGMNEQQVREAQANRTLVKDVTDGETGYVVDCEWDSEHETLGVIIEEGEDFRRFVDSLDIELA